VAAISERVVALGLILSLGVLSAMAQQEAKQQKQVKDQGEYDLLQLVNKEAAGPKKIELLDQWKQKYPETEFREDRAMVYVQTYQALGDGPKMWDACEELLSINPKSAPALFFLMSLSTSLNDASKYDKGESYTKQFLAMLPEIYAGKEGDAQAMKEKKVQESTARKTLGQIAMNRKDYPTAEALSTEYLKWEPHSGNVSYTLGNAILLQKDKTKQIPALWHLARSAYYKGEDALPEPSRKQLQTFFEKNYVKYHGSKDGMQEVIDASLREPFPPPDWTILSEAQVLQNKLNKLKEENPQLYMWLQLKEGLTGPGGPEYWESTLKGAAMPKFKGKVISSSPPVKTKEVIVGITGPDLSEVKLLLEQPVGKVEPGTEIEFEGAVPKEFTADPFMVTAEVENSKVTGLPKATGPAPRLLPRKPAAKKK
jgi:tetratricopeptide (TPR) repeat protein